MKSASAAVLVTVIAVVFTGAACAQQSGMPTLLPSSPPSSAPVPAAAASKPIPARSAAVEAAVKSNEVGKLPPEQRVIPQITVPLKGRDSVSSAAPAASLSAGGVPGAVNDGAARCLATIGAAEKAACERGLAASGPLKTGR